MNQLNVQSRVCLGRPCSRPIHRIPSRSLRSQANGPSQSLQGLEDLPCISQRSTHGQICTAQGSQVDSRLRRTEYSVQGPVTLNFLKRDSISTPVIRLLGTTVRGSYTLPSCCLIPVLYPAVANTEIDETFLLLDFCTVYNFFVVLLFFFLHIVKTSFNGSPPTFSRWDTCVKMIIV